MSKTDLRRWASRFTHHGFRLGGGESGDGLQLHECGLARMGNWWNFQGVRSPFWRLYYNFSAGCSIRSGGKRYAMPPTSALLVPGGVQFDCHDHPGVTHSWIHFSLYPVLTPEHVLVVPATRAFRSAAATVRRELRVPQPPANRVRHLAAAMLHLALAEADLDLRAPRAPRLQGICDWIERSLGQPITNGELAAQAGMSVEAFIRWFRSAMGRTPAAYVAERRVQEASRRLAFSDESIEHIAEAVGFANRHHFSRVFKRFAGNGPAGFRRGHRL